VQGIITEIRSATATMTSVPKPLKFLSPHVDGLKARYEQLSAGSESKLMLADILSVLCTTIAVREGARDALTYRLQVLTDTGTSITSTVAHLLQPWLTLGQSKLQSWDLGEESTVSS